MPQSSDPQAPAADVELKTGKIPPPGWLLRTLSITALTFTILGGELILDGLVRGNAWAVGDTQVPTYVPGAVFLILGGRNLFSWYQMKQAIARQSSTESSNS